VIVPDVNLLLYAHFDVFEQHEPAREWWQGLLSDKHEVGIATIVVFGFVRVATNRRVFKPPMTVVDALGAVEGWLARPNVRVLVPGPRHLEIAFGLLRAAGTGGDLTTDAQIAALALEHQAELHSNDSDFARFSGLRWIDPLG
jgi:toxin-antitoxin system PIN domain toxin